MNRPTETRLTESFETFSMGLLYVVHEYTKYSMDGETPRVVSTEYKTDDDVPVQRLSEKTFEILRNGESIIAVSN